MNTGAQPFYSFYQLISDERLIPLKPGREAPQAVLFCRNDPTIFRAASEALEKLGFRRFRCLGTGAGAIAMDTTENQVVRMSITFPQFLAVEAGNRPEHPAVLQPISRELISLGKKGMKLIIEVLPKVRTTGVTKQHIAMLKEALEKSGYHPYDIAWEGNVGLIEADGREIPVLIDSGATDKVGKPQCGNEYLKPWLASDGTWLQRKLEKRSQPSNVIPRDKMVHLEKTLTKGKRQSQTIKAIREDGLYASELAELYRHTAEKLTAQDNSASFSDLLKQERARRKDHSIDPSIDHN